MAKAKELREMSSEQLGFALRETQEKLFRLRVQSATEKLDAPSQVREFRREIARIHTLLRERASTAAPH